MSAFLLPSRNSITRYWSDWKPDASPSTPRNFTYSLGVSVASTPHCSNSWRWICLTRASFFRHGPTWSARRSSSALLSSWITSRIHSSDVWCCTMNSISSWCSGCDSGCCAPSRRSSRR
jgi:hypothetical protein